MGNAGEWMRLKQEPGDLSRKSAPVCTNKSLLLDQSGSRATLIPNAGGGFVPVGAFDEGASLYSLIETAKANEPEPYAYLRHLFPELPKATTVEANKSSPPQADGVFR